MPHCSVHTPISLPHCSVHNPHFVASRVGEVEPASAGEVERLCRHGAARRAHRFDAAIQVIGVEEYQRGASVPGGVEAAGFTFS